MDYIQRIKNWGLVLLGIWLILWGVLPLLSISFPVIILELLAIAAGVLLLLRK